MIAALYSSRPQGAKDFMRNNHQFGWQTIQKVFAENLERAENGWSRKVPGFKYAHVYRDNSTHLNSDESGKTISMVVNKWSTQASFHCLSARVTNYAM